MIQIWDFSLNFWFLVTLLLIFFILGLLVRGSGSGGPGRYR
jgi:hypothetical protein